MVGTCTVRYIHSTVKLPSVTVHPLFHFVVHNLSSGIAKAGEGAARPGRHSREGGISVQMQILRLSISLYHCTKMRATAAEFIRES